MQETQVQSLGWEDPLEKGMAGESHRQRNMAGYSPWGHKQSDMTEWLRYYYHLESLPFYWLGWTLLPFVVDRLLTSFLIIFLIPLLTKNYTRLSFLSLTGGFFFSYLAWRPLLLAIGQKLNLLEEIAKKDHLRVLEERMITGTFNYQYRKEKIDECSLGRMSWHRHCEQHLSTLTRDLTQESQEPLQSKRRPYESTCWPKIQQNVNKLHVHSVMSDLMDYSPPASSVHRILQARILEWVAISYSRGSSQPRDGTQVTMSPALAGRFFITASPGIP